jgi:ActR/RegA family two-component response regulator
MSMSDALRQPVGLIVEDDSLYARTLQRSLRKHGFEFEVAVNLDEALAVAHSASLDLAVIDLYLGEQSGLDLIAPQRRIRPAVRVVMHRRSLQRKLARQPPHQREPGEAPLE